MTTRKSGWVFWWTWDDQVAGAEESREQIKHNSLERTICALKRKQSSSSTNVGDSYAACSYSKDMFSKLYVNDLQTRRAVDPGICDLIGFCESLELGR